MNPIPSVWRALLLSSMAWAGTASAEPSALERSTAEALFQQGVQLVDAGDLTEGCKKFEGSLQLDKALGTMLRLADCYDRSDKSASAWGMFEQVRALSATAGDERRQAIAATRAKDVQRRLSLLQLEVDSSMVAAGADVSIAGTVLPQSSWDTGVPLDPGTVQVQATAIGYAPWQKTVVISKGPSSQRLLVPPLTPLAAPIAAPIATAPQATPLATADSRFSAPTWVYILGGVGAAALGTSGYLAYRAMDLDEKSLQDCRTTDPQACNAQGVSTRKRALRSARFATVSLGVGAAALTGAVATWLYGSRSVDEQGLDGPNFAASLTPHSGGIEVRGTW